MISGSKSGNLLWAMAFSIGLLMSVSTRAADVVEAQPQWVPDTKQAQSPKEAPQRLALGMHLTPLVDLPTAAQGAANQLEALEERKRKGLQPLQVGFERSIPAQTINFTLKDALAGGPANGAQFLTTQGSDVIWSSRIRVAGAFAFRLHLEDVKLPRSARIWIYNAAGNYLGPFDNKRIDDDDGLWLPPLEGSVMFLEIRVSADDLARGASVGFTLRQISELVPFSSNSDGSTPSPNTWTDCDIDVSCENGAPFNIDDYARSVARLLFTSDAGGQFLCSGALVNDQVPETFAPWLLTANHCFDSNTEANSLVSYFDYRTDSCGGTIPSLGSVPQVNGATMMASNPSSDFSFIHLNELPPGRFLLGWTTGSPNAGQTMYSISHPAGQVANYNTTSFNATGGIVCGGFDRPDFHYSSGVSGSTAGGSSGSPVYNSTGQIFGQLYGTCSFPDADACSYSTFNRLDGAFGTTYTSIVNWLDGTWPPPDPPPSCVDDGYEEDDVCFGNFIGVGNFQDHKHCDEDWVYFGATMDHTYVIETTAIIGDTTLALHDSCGPEFAFNDDGGAGLASRIEWTADANATIDIRVRQFADAYTDGELYTISVTDVTPPPSTLTVVKYVDGGAATVADFAITSSAGALSFDSGVGTNPTVYTTSPVMVAPGTYTLVETDIADYTEGTWSCAPNAGGGSFDNGVVTLAEGEGVTCTITNTYSAPVWDLSVTKSGTGSGTVTDNLLGIDCGGDCSESYADGTSVTLTANAAAGSQFVSWSGSCSGSIAAFGLTMDANKTCDAMFSILDTCNVNTVSGVIENGDASFEACDLLTIDSFTAETGSTIALSSGRNIVLGSGFLIERGASLNANVCGQSICEASVLPMPYGCHSCVDQICDIDATCCGLEFNEACLDKVDTVCGLACE